MASRRWPKPRCGSAWKPSPSGPRWRCASVIARKLRIGGTVGRKGWNRPAIPHINATLSSITRSQPHPRRFRHERLRSRLAVCRPVLIPRSGAGDAASWYEDIACPLPRRWSEPPPTRTSSEPLPSGSNRNDCAPCFERLGHGRAPRWSSSFYPCCSGAASRASYYSPSTSSAAASNGRPARIQPTTSRNPSRSPSGSARPSATRAASGAPTERRTSPARPGAW